MLDFIFSLKASSGWHEYRVDLSVEPSTPEEPSYARLILVRVTDDMFIYTSDRIRFEDGWIDAFGWISARPPRAAERFMRNVMHRVFDETPFRLPMTHRTRWSRREDDLIDGVTYFETAFRNQSSTAWS